MASGMRRLPSFLRLAKVTEDAVVQRAGSIVATLGYESPAAPCTHTDCGLDDCVLDDGHRAGRHRKVEPIARFALKTHSVRKSPDTTIRPLESTR